MGKPSAKQLDPTILTTTNSATLIDFAYDNSTTTGSVSVTIPANTLTVDGQTIEIHASSRIGTLDSWTAAGFSAVPGLTFSQTQGSTRWTITRIGATSAFWTSEHFLSGGTSTGNSADEPITVDWSIAQTITLNFSSGGTPSRVVLRATSIK